MWIGTNVKLHPLYWTIVALFDVVHNLYVQIRSQTSHRSDIKKISDLRSDIKKISDLWLAQVWYLTDNAWLGVHYCGRPGVSVFFLRAVVQPSFLLRVVYKAVLVARAANRRRDDVREMRLPAKRCTHSVDPAGVNVLLNTASLLTLYCGCGICSSKDACLFLLKRS